MTGRELIAFILANKLEDVDIYNETDGLTPEYIGLLDTKSMALVLGVGEETVKALVKMKTLDGFTFGDRVLVISNSKVKAYKEAQCTRK